MTAPRPQADRRTPRFRLRTRALVIGIAALVAATTGAIVTDAVLRSRVESQLADARSPVNLSLGSGSVLWGYITGSMHVDAHVDATQLRDAISAKAGLDVGDVTLSDGTILASLDSGPVSTFLGGDVVIALTPSAHNGQLTVSISGITIAGEERAGTVLANQFGEVTIDPAEMTDCAAATGVSADSVSVQADEMIVSLSVPRDVAQHFASCS